MNTPQAPMLSQLNLVVRDVPTAVAFYRRLVVHPKRLEGDHIEHLDAYVILSLIGGLIIAAVDTEGKPSLGWRGRRAAHKVTEAVAAAMPAAAASGPALADSALAEKLGQGLHPSLLHI